QPEQPLRQSELVEDPATPLPEIRWAKRFEPRDGAFDDATRLNLLRDLGIVRAPWGVPLLTQAYEEEPAAEHRRAALRALAAYRHPDTQPTFELALRAEDEETRAIAANALTALSIRAALPS
ncbi:MAG TPA: HEAT repeat domain-containing protein, partial [Xanthomonadales bacterium]|nr:HEAT repeat domain-containing protein [Xanthomonadales bacterium]